MPLVLSELIGLRCVLLQFWYSSQSWLCNVDSLTHWGRLTHICFSKLTIIGSDNGLLPGRHQAIIWTNAGILLIEHLGTNFSEILNEIHTFSFKKMHWKMLSGKWRPCCLGLNVSAKVNDPGHLLEIPSLRQIQSHCEYLLTCNVCRIVLISTTMNKNSSWKPITSKNWKPNIWTETPKGLMKSSQL